jgi:hypothetical protein
MRRSVGEGVQHRFVTGERLELLLKVRTNLVSVSNENVSSLENFNRNLQISLRLGLLNTWTVPSPFRC